MSNIQTEISPKRKDQLLKSIKTLYTEIIDHLNDLRDSTDDKEVKRISSVAITESQTAQM